MTFKRTNVRNSPTFAGGQPYVYRSSSQTRVDIDQMYTETGWGRASGGPWPALGPIHYTLANAFGGPDSGQGSPETITTVGDGVTAGSYIEFANPAVDNVWGVNGARARISYGTPPGGDFVPVGTAGVNYVSPGYQ